MPNFAGVLRDEVRRLARKEIKTELSATKRASVQYRKDIAALKRQVQDQARQISILQRASRRADKAGSGDPGSVARFSPKWLRSHREKLELSAADYAALVGVSAQTVYNWETGKTRPQQEQLKSWTAVRRLGKRDAWKRLDDIG